MSDFQDAIPPGYTPHGVKPDLCSSSQDGVNTYASQKKKIQGESQ